MNPRFGVESRSVFWSLLVLVVVLMVIPAAFAVSEKGEMFHSPGKRLGLYVENGVLMKGGRPYRGIGVNYFSAFYGTINNPKNKSYKEGFRILREKYNIPFIRFNAGGFWPSDWKLYLTNRKKYFQLFDEFVHAAEKQGLGLIPVLFWYYSTVPDLVGEPVDQLGNPKSKTLKFMKTYIREVVERYRNSPAIWGWEIGNEYNLPADLPNASKHRPMIAPPRYGTPRSRSKLDDVSHDMIRTVMSELAKEIRKYDPYRIIETGDSVPRLSAWHQWKELSWTKDTPEQQAEMLGRSAPDPINVISVHTYGGDVKRIGNLVSMAHKFGKPLFVGEFGVSGTEGKEKARRMFFKVLNDIVKYKVPLAALWVFELPDHNKKHAWNITADNDRAYMLEALRKANEKIHP